MLQPAATVTLLWLLQAKAKVESASVKMKPPWQILWPLRCSSRTVMRSTARPGSQLTSSMPMVSGWRASGREHGFADAACKLASPPSFALELRGALLAGTPSRPRCSRASCPARTACRARRRAGCPGRAWPRARISLRVATSALVGIAASRCASFIGGGNAVLALGRHVPDHSPFLRVLRAELVAQHRRAHGARQPQLLDQEPGAAGVGHQADLAEGLDEAGVRAATARSQVMASDAPAPAATPLTAAMVGTRSASSLRTVGLKAFSITGPGIGPLDQVGAGREVELRTGRRRRKSRGPRR